MASEKYLAIDIGASSGRAIVGTLEDGKITLPHVSMPMLLMSGNAPF